MLHNTLSPQFLRVLNVDSELWEETRLGTPVSPLTVEAMNHILLQDGIPAFIGTREEFGDYLQTLQNETVGDSPRCWTFMSTHTILGYLGLCRYTGESGRSDLIFYGSPLTLAVAVLIACHRLSWNVFSPGFVLQPTPAEIFSSVRDGVYLLPNMAEIGCYALCNDGDRFLTGIDFQYASSFIKE